jgi:hypothetical protein
MPGAVPAEPEEKPLLTTALIFADGAIFGAVFATIAVIGVLRYVINDPRE